MKGFLGGNMFLVIPHWLAAMHCGSQKMAKQAVTILIGPLECDRQMVCPITFKVLPPPSKRFFMGSVPDGPVI